MQNDLSETKLAARKCFIHHKKNNSHFCDRIDVQQCKNLLESNSDAIQKRQTGKDGRQKMGQRLSKNSDAIVVAGEGVGQRQGHLADFVGPEDADRVLFHDRLNGFGKGQNQVKENLPFFGFLKE